MHFLSAYGLFLAKIITLLVAIFIFVGLIIALSRKGKGNEGKLEVKNLNEKYDEYSDAVNEIILTKSEFKKIYKEKSKAAKKKPTESKKRVYHLNFLGDMKASSVNNLREEINAILRVATPQDEVVVTLESGGGMVPHYGLAASQLQRLKQKKIPLTVIIDKIAASGGYLMACVADRILAAPFAIIGSIGVVAQLPNFHRLLKKNDIDFELLTAGQYKRTLTMFGENTEKGREKMQQEVEEIHHLFKNFIAQNRPQVIVEQIATGEHWLASRALELQLIDGLTTSDDYLLTASERAEVFQINYSSKKSFGEKLGSLLTAIFYGWHY